MISGQRAAFAIKVFGESLRELRRVAAAVKRSIEDVPGLVDVGVESVVDIPQLVVRIDPARAASYGLSSGEAATAVGTALWGATPSRILEQGVATDVVVRYPDRVTTDVESVARARVPTPSGASVPVSAFADLRRESGPNYVLRENVERRVVVTANVADRDLRSVYEDVRRAVDERVERPDGVRIELSGQFERAEAAGTRLVLFGLLAVIGIGIIVGTTLRSARRALIVLVNLPLALAGGVVGVYLAGGVLSVATMIGFITLFGIAARNGTPMALVILTGLATSTALNMAVVPALLSRWGGPTR